MLWVVGAVTLFGIAIYGLFAQAFNWFPYDGK